MDISGDDFDPTADYDSNYTVDQARASVEESTALQPLAKTSDQIISEAATATITQAVKTIDMLDKTARLIDTVSASATFEQNLQLMKESRKLAVASSSAINATANLLLALGVKVQCNTNLQLANLIPPAMLANRPQLTTGFEQDESLPTASKYQFTFTVTTTQDITARAIVDLLLRGSGCQTVGRTVGNDWVTVRVENRQQLVHAVAILRNASYQGKSIVSIGTLTTLIKSAYALRSYAFEARTIQEWFDNEGKLIHDKAITSLNEENSGWFPNNDVECVEFTKASPPPGKDKKLEYIILKIFVSQAAYRHFLRSSHDITNIEINGSLVKVKEEVNIIQCWNCCQFGHYSNQCPTSFQCRFCTNDHAKSITCPNNEAPTCRLCTANNFLLDKKLKSGDKSPGVANFKDWKKHPTNHFATSFSCKTVQAVKATHLFRLKHASFNRQPLPSFSFP